MTLLIKEFKNSEDISEEQFLQFLKDANDSYYTSDTPILTDEEFDWGKKEFTKKFGYAPEIGTKKQLSKGFVKVRHEIAMGSIEEFSTTNDVKEEIKKWLKKYSKEDLVCVSEKLDGLSVFAKYEKGTLKKALTRGDGFEGDDITNNVKKMMGVVIEDKNFSGKLKGEIVLTKSMFKQHFSDKANERNAAVGTTKRLDGVGCEYLSVFFYKVYPEGLGFKTETEGLDYIKNTLKFKTPRYYKVTLDLLFALHERYEKEVREKLDYLIDGLVVNIDNLERQKEITENELLPEYARKFKFEAETAETELLCVKPQVGRTGVITPLAILEPVVCGGTLISKVTLHNFDEIKRLGIDTGDIIKLKKAGDVIPKIIGVVKKNEYSTKILPPTECPECGEKVEKIDVLYYCRNENCGAITSKALLHWLNVLNIKNMGEKLVEALIESGKLKTIPDFYKLTIEDISSLERQGEKNATRILKEINDKKIISIPELLAGVNIRNLSVKRAEILEDNFGSLENIFNIKISDVLKLDGFEEKLATFVYTGLKAKKPLIEEILKYIKIKPKVEGTLTGKSFCFSGFRDDNIEKNILSKGGKVSESFNKKIDYLVVKSKNSTTSKMKKAEQYGTSILDISDLEKILHNTLF